MPPCVHALRPSNSIHHCSDCTSVYDEFPYISVWVSTRQCMTGFRTSVYEYPHASVWRVSIHQCMSFHTPVYDEFPYISVWVSTCQCMTGFRTSVYEFPHSSVWVSIRQCITSTWLRTQWTYKHVGLASTVYIHRIWPCIFEEIPAKKKYINHIHVWFWPIMPYVHVLIAPAFKEIHCTNIDHRPTQHSVTVTSLKNLKDHVK